jgi:S-adenosylmethionine/arginine decarboxylase-like enzyme
MWGFHLILDVGGCDVDAMKSESTIRAFLDELLERTKMNPLGEPIFKFIPPTPETLEKRIDGFSVVQVITTSSVVMHFVDSERAIFVDFFSCKKFDQEEVAEIVEKYFKYTSSKRFYIERDILTPEDAINAQY